MHWDYRLVKRKINGGIELGVYEVYYEDGEIVAMTEKPADLTGYGETLEEAIENLKLDIKWVQKAFSEPVLDIDELDKQFTQKGRLGGEEE